MFVVYFTVLSQTLVRHSRSFSRVTGYGLNGRNLIPGKERDSPLRHYFHIVSKAHSASYPLAIGPPSPKVSGQSVKLTTYLHLVPKSGMSGGLPPQRYTP